MRKHRLIMLGGLLASAVAVGCQAPATTPVPQPREVVNRGRVALDPSTDFAVFVSRPCDDDGTYKLAQTARKLDPRITYFEIDITGDALIGKRTIKITAEEFLGECAMTAQVQQLPPGKYQALMNGYDKDGNVVVSGKSGEMLLGTGPTQTLEVECDFTLGKLAVHLNCCNSPAPTVLPSGSPTPAPSPTPTPDPTPTPTPTPVPTTTPALGMWDIAVHDGEVWTANLGADSVSRLDAQGEPAESFPAGDGAISLAFADDGTIWVANQTSVSSITRLTTTGQVAAPPILIPGITPNSVPYRIRKAPNGDMWVSGRIIYRISPTGTILGRFDPGSNTHDVAFGSTNALVTHRTGRRLTRIPLTAVTGATPAPVTPTVIAAAPFGIETLPGSEDYWIADFDFRKVSRFTADGPDADLNEDLVLSTSSFSPPPTFADPIELIVEPSGIVWAALQGEDRVARIDPVARTVVKYAAGVQPTGITRAPDGTIWVANRGSNRATAITASSTPAP